MRLTNISHTHDWLFAPSNLDVGGLGWQPLTKHGPPQVLQQASLLSSEDRLQLPPLLGVCIVSYVQTSRPIAVEEITRPLSCKRNLRSTKIDTIGAATLNIESQLRAAPSLIRLSLRPKPART